MEINSPSDVLPLMDKFELKEGLELFKLSKGFTLLDAFEPQKAKDIVYFILKKEENGKTIYRILRYRKPLNSVAIDSEFVAVDMDDVAVNLFRAISDHLM